MHYKLTCFPFFLRAEPQQSDLSNGGLLGVEDEDRCTLASFLSFLRNLPRARIRKDNNNITLHKDVNILADSLS